MIRVKICGITNYEDAVYASEMGAHALGFILFEGSKRYICPQDAREICRLLPPFVIKVGVFVNEQPEKMLKISEQIGLDRIQIHADVMTPYENLPADKVIFAHRIKDRKDVEKALSLPYFPLFDRYDADAYGGTGKSFDWSLLKGIERPYILAGGINLDNIDDAIAINPYAIDIASGVEVSYGKKDHKKLFEIFRKLRENQKI